MDDGDLDLECGGKMLSLRFKNPRTDASFNMSVSTDTTIKELRELVRDELPDARDKNLRLIYSGKLLDNDNKSVSFYKLRDNGFVHCVISSNTHSSPSGVIAPAPVAHHVVGTSDIEDERRGFGILQSQGLSPAEIQAIRVYFAGSVQRLINTTPREEGESEEAHMLRVEEIWVQSQDSASEFAVNIRPPSMQSATASRGTFDPADSNSTFMWGFFMGFCFGIFMLFWVWDSSMGYRQKLGILSGVSANIMLGMGRRKARNEEEAIVP